MRLSVVTNLPEPVAGSSAPPFVLVSFLDVDVFSFLVRNFELLQKLLKYNSAQVSFFNNSYINNSCLCLYISLIWYTIIKPFPVKMILITPNV